MVPESTNNNYFARRRKVTKPIPDTSLDKPIAGIPLPVMYISHHTCMSQEEVCLEWASYPNLCPEWADKKIIFYFLFFILYFGHPLLSMGSYPNLYLEWVDLPYRKIALYFLFYIFGHPLLSMGFYPNLCPKWVEILYRKIIFYFIICHFGLVKVVMVTKKS